MIGLVMMSMLVVCWVPRAQLSSWVAVQEHEVACKQTLSSSRSARPQDAHASEMRATGTTAGTTRMIDYSGDPDDPDDHPNAQTTRALYTTIRTTLKFHVALSAPPRTTHASLLMLSVFC